MRLIWNLLLISSFGALALASGLLLRAALYPSSYWWVAFLWSLWLLLLVLRPAARGKRGFGFLFRISVALLSAGLLGWAVLTSIPEQRKGSGNLQSLRLGPSSYNFFSPARWIAESDQLLMGSWILPYVDPYLSQSEGKRLRDSLKRLYGEMKSDPDFGNQASELTSVYADLAGFPLPEEQFYYYRPRGSVGKKVPVLLFVHGSFGSWLSYAWVLKKLADQLQMAIVSPSYGMGFWNRAEGLERIERVLTWISSQADLDETKIVLAGLSNGGRAVTRAFQRHPTRFLGLMFISPVLESEFLLGSPAGHKMKALPILIVTGEKDMRISFRYIQDSLALLHNDSRFRVTLSTFSEEDHYLIFTRSDEFTARAKPWIKALID